MRDESVQPGRPVGPGRGESAGWPRWLLALVAGMLMLFGSGGGLDGGSISGPAAARAADQRPNIVLLLVDDLRADDMMQLPRLQEMLVAQGTAFRRFFAPNALCCPARTSILRGQFSHNHGVWTNFANRSGGYVAATQLNLEPETIAVWLQRAGYDTALMGKYLNDYGKDVRGIPDRTHVPPGWTEWFGLIDPKGDAVYRGYDYAMNANGAIRNFGTAATDYATDVLAREARSFIERRGTGPRKPFFLYLAPTAPHTPIQPAPRHQPNPYAGFVPTFPPSFNAADVSDKPLWIQQIPRMSRGQTDRIVADIRRRLGSMLAVEDMLQDLLDALAARGELGNTYIFFASDNGLQLGEHRLGSKATVYDEAVRVPLVVRGPGIAAGDAVDLMVYNHDLATTFAAIAGATTAPFVDGVSLLPLLDPATRPAASAWRRSVLLEHRAHNDKPKTQPDAFSIRTNNYQYVEYASAAQRCELYRIAADQDPYRLTNRCDDPALASVQARLAARLRDLQRCSGNECRRLEFLPVP